MRFVIFMYRYLSNEKSMYMYRVSLCYVCYVHVHMSCMSQNKMHIIFTGSSLVKLIQIPIYMYIYSKHYNIARRRAGFSAVPTVFLAVLIFLHVHISIP